MHLPTLNVILNGLSAICLIIARVCIAKKHKRKHAITMIVTMCLSTIFLASYLYYHYTTQVMTPYKGEGWTRPVYFFILTTHIILAMLVPFGAIWAFTLAYLRKWEAHVKVVKFVWPIWLYVSVTGVVIYCALYI